MNRKPTTATARRTRKRPATAPALAGRRPTGRPKRRAPRELSEQIELAKDLDRAKLLWCHVPNEGRRGRQTAATLKPSGVKCGVPDVLIFTPPPKYPEARGAAIELKRIDGTQSDVSTEQHGWLNDLSDLGWITGVAFGAAEARTMLQAAGYDL